MTITLVGGKALGTDPYDSTDFGVKGLVSMMGGTVQMFGYTAGPSWTRLSSNAMNSSSSLQLQDAVQWRAGDTILIASTDFAEVVRRQHTPQLFYTSTYCIIGGQLPRSARDESDTERVFRWKDSDAVYTSQLHSLGSRLSESRSGVRPFYPSHLPSKSWNSASSVY